MKKILSTILIIALLISGCQRQPTVHLTLPTATTTTAIPTPLAATPIPYQSTPTPMPTKPKYIFIIIGDGLGQGHMLMGNIYARVEGQSMDSGAVWESWPQQKFVTGKGESAKGGSAVATGYGVKIHALSLTPDNQSLVTIMDRAKENGFATGVVTNSDIADATPGAFYAHTEHRYNFEEIVAECPYGNVDYLAGGGIYYYVPGSRKDEYDDHDARGKSISPKYEYTSLATMEEMGYSTYIGNSGAQRYLQLVRDHDFHDQQSICLFTTGVMPYEIDQMIPRKVERYEHLPSLVEMTDAGIQTLSQNPNGFVMMIEEAHIDKSGHEGWQEATLAQVRLLNDTLKQIMQFYNEHPYETLVILTSDHENGDYVWDMDRYNAYLEYDDFVYTNDADDMYEFLRQKWNFSMDIDTLQDGIDINNARYWDTDTENIANLYNNVAYQTAISLGIERTSMGHTNQPVPCYSIGISSERFDSCQIISDIPTIIAQVMDWSPLPEIIEN